MFIANKFCHSKMYSREGYIFDSDSLNIKIK